jgi:hypothetical protein
MQWRHATGGGDVRIGAGLDEIGNDVPLALGVPGRRAGDADYRGVQWFGASPVSPPNVGTTIDEVSRHLGVITERRSM